ncbi:MAG: hypothetical protein KF774_03090 [Planctomyces sp.]|nr:hypothetical protein [Planctomyces sp.]
MTAPKRRPNNVIADSPRTLECVEVYLPKTLEHLSELYNYLRSKLKPRGAGPDSQTIDGFSMYEVDGAFAGERIYQERTLVIRMLFLRADGDDERSIHRKIETLGREIASTVAIAEEQLWICHYPQGVVIFRPRGAS